MLGERCGVAFTEAQLSPAQGASAWKRGKYIDRLEVEIDEGCALKRLQLQYSSPMPHGGLL